MSRCRLGFQSLGAGCCQRPQSRLKEVLDQSCLEWAVIEVVLVLGLHQVPDLAHHQGHRLPGQRLGSDSPCHQRQRHWSCCEQARCVLDQKLDQGSAKRPLDCQCSVRMFVELMLFVALAV